MLRRIALLAFSSFCLIGAAAPRAVGAQNTRRLSDKDVPVLTQELRAKLTAQDSAGAAASTPAPAADEDTKAVVAAAVQALHDLNDPTDLTQSEACAAQWGSRDAAGAALLKDTQARRHNLDLLTSQADVLLPLLEKYVQSTK